MTHDNRANSGFTHPIYPAGPGSAATRPSPAAAHAGPGKVLQRSFGRTQRLADPTEMKRTLSWGSARKGAAVFKQGVP